ncbi:MAG: hypothetical protein VB140_07245 [Burkholderia sp.]
MQQRPTTPKKLGSDAVIRLNIFVTSYRAKTFHMKYASWHANCETRREDANHTQTISCTILPFLALKENDHHGTHE